MRSIPPGVYSVKYEMTGFAPSEIANVSLALGKTLRADISLQEGQFEQAVTVVESSPQIDLTSTTVGHTISADEIARLPKGRSFQALLLTSPSVTSGVDSFGNIVGIEGGFQVNGASSGENQFNIDGISTNSAVNGRSRQNATLEFVKEVQVKTGGVEAEYGSAMGGVLSAVTKSGGSQFHGSLWYYLAGNKLSAGPIQRLLLDPVDITKVSYVQEDKNKDNRNEFGGDFGGPLVADKFYFYVASSPQWRRRANDYLFNNGREPATFEQKQLVHSSFGKVSFDPTSRIRTN
ncbi:MAG: TonB-dependent receptor, partial [Acidobacteria bacterium]|nr:TonB-dependent receptor [Acidobacteriota bacterium]